MSVKAKHLVLILTMSLTGCSTFLEILVDTNTSERELYDKYVCEHGEESPPGVARRVGCVNNKGTLENYEEFEKYRIERDLYLGKKDRNEK